MRIAEGLLGLTGVFLMGASAYAQVESSTSPSSTALEEVIVTAQKRTENLQNVPIAITAISSESLARSGISTTQSLSFSVPALVYSSTGAYAQPYLRGIGSELTIPNADPSVTTYIDGVVVSTTAGLIQNLDMLGIDRVEVSEGPQGTLNGRNATAGAISIYTLTPTQTPEAEAKLTYGDYNLKQISGHMSGGVSNDLALGVYGGFSDRDSYIKQLGNGPSPNSERNTAVRVKGVFTPTEAIRLTGSIEFEQSRSREAGAFRNIENPDLEVTLGIPNAVQPPYVINTGPNNLGGSTLVDNTLFAATLREEDDFDWARFLGITGYRNLKAEEGNDIDGTPLGIVQAVAVPLRSKQFSQELQLISPDKSYVKWIAGLYYLQENAGLEPNAILSDVIFPAPINGSWSNTYANLNSYAAFAQATIPLVDRLSLTLGGRYTVDRKVWNATGWLSTGPSYTLIPGTTTVYPTEQRTFENFTPKVTLDYKFDNAMVYATFARGYKAGAFNLASPSIPMPPAVKPEKLDDYEIGVKLQTLDDRLRINGSGYYYDYSDIQTSIITTSSGGNTVLQNAASARLYGAELSLEAVVTSELHLNGNLGWQKTRYTSFPNAASFNFTASGNPASVFDATGNELPRAPKWVSSIGPEYDHKFASGGSISLSANWLYNGGFYWEATNRFEQRAYTLVNSNVGYTFPGGRFEISAFVKNLTNQYYANSLIILPTAIGVQDAPPRMYGMSVDYKMR